MKITILTLLPQMFLGPFDHSIIKHAQEKGLVEIVYKNIRDFGIGKHKVVDDTPYGGGVGMVMKVDVLDRAITAVKEKNLNIQEQRVVLLDPHGQQFSQTKARDYSALQHLILLCAHYEGVDERVKTLVDEEISIGDFVVTGGEIPAMLVTDAVVRLLPGVLKPDATAHESFSIPDETSTETKLLEFPHYTTPPVYNDRSVPEVLLSGNHKKIAVWRKEEAKKVTEKLRPDLIQKI